MSRPAAQPTQMTMKLSGERAGQAGVIPAHVHRFAQVEVLETLGGFLAVVVTDVDRWGSSLALLLFGQVFLQRKQTQPSF